MLMLFSIFSCPSPQNQCCLAEHSISSLSLTQCLRADFKVVLFYLTDFNIDFAGRLQK